MKEIKNILIIGGFSSRRYKDRLANALLNKNNNFEEIFREEIGSSGSY
jgi:hypothetical protein